MTPFLYPPYPGSASQSSIFDHTSPNYTDTDRRIVVFNGAEARKICPVPAPPGTPPPGGVCDAGFGLYWSYSVGDYISYNGHDGIDYGISYRPVYSAADADQVKRLVGADEVDGQASPFPTSCTGPRASSPCWSPRLIAPPQAPRRSQ